MSSPTPIPGVRNLRDLGGQVTADGSTIAPGRLYRAELLTDANPNESNAPWTEDISDAVDALGLAAVIDLRSDPERAGSPSRWVRDGTRHVEIPIDNGAPGSPTDLVAAVFSGAMERFTVEDMTEYYVTMFDERAPELALGVREIADAGGPVLVHCSAGKDRTGALIAMVLALVGVEHAAILDDYVLTGTNRPDRVLHYVDVLARKGLTPEHVRPMFETPRISLEASLAGLIERYGSIEAYLVELGGYDPATTDRLRAALLT